MLLARSSFRRKFTLAIPASFNGDVVSPNTFLNMTPYPAETVYYATMSYAAFDTPSGDNATSIANFNQNGRWDGAATELFGGGRSAEFTTGPSFVTAQYGKLGSDPEALGLNVINPLAAEQNGVFDISVAISLPGSFVVPIGQGGCFLAGTLVGTPEGYVKIEKLKIGTKVFSYDSEISEMVHSEVTKLAERPSIGHYEVVVGDEKLLVTGEHPFYVPELNLFVSVHQLGIGTKVKQVDGPDLPITKITFIRKSLPVYNLSVDNMHNYFVGNRGILVHNK